MPNNSQRTGEWFQAFYERNYKLVYRLCFTYMKNQADNYPPHPEHVPLARPAHIPAAACFPTCRSDRWGESDT